jgi:hypothetical protein
LQDVLCIHDVSRLHENEDGCRVSGMLLDELTNLLLHLVSLVGFCQLIQLVEHRNACIVEGRSSKQTPFAVEYDVAWLKDKWNRLNALTLLSLVADFQLYHEVRIDGSADVTSDL